jgi:hypothetical protein
MTLCCFEVSWIGLRSRDVLPEPAVSHGSRIGND